MAIADFKAWNEAWNEAWNDLDEEAKVDGQGGAQCLRLAAVAMREEIPANVVSMRLWILKTVGEEERRRGYGL